MLRLLCEISTERREGQVGRGCGSHGNNGRGYGCGYSERNRNCCTPNNANFDRHVTDSYCWTHGGCNHTSADCTLKALVYKDDATRENCMGGSNTFCQPNVEWWGKMEKVISSQDKINNVFKKKKLLIYFHNLTQTKTWNRIRHHHSQRQQCYEPSLLARPR